MRLLTKPAKAAKKKQGRGVVVRSAEGVRFAYTSTQIKPAAKTKR